VSRALLQSFEKRLCGGRRLSMRRLLASAQGLCPLKKAVCVREVDVQSLDLLDEHHDRTPGRSDLFAWVMGQALTPVAKRLDLVFIEGRARRSVRLCLLKAAP
jgi:hypothetical protein